MSSVDPEEQQRSLFAYFVCTTILLQALSLSLQEGCIRGHPTPDISPLIPAFSMSLLQ